MHENGKGFDLLIGNPPYVRGRSLSDTYKQFIESRYSSATEGEVDIYILFYEKAVSLLKCGGELGFISSNKWSTTAYGKKLRKKLLNEVTIKEIDDVSNIMVFKDASTYPWIIFIEKMNPRKNHQINVKRNVERSEDLKKRKTEKLQLTRILESENYIISLDVTKKVEDLFEKMEKSTDNLISLCRINEGIHTGNVRDKLLFDKKKGRDLQKSTCR